MHVRKLLIVATFGINLIRPVLKSTKTADA